MATVVLQETLKYKDGRKWKTRWGVLRRLSPVAVPDLWNAQNTLPDRLHISFFKDANDQRKNNPEKASIALEDFYGIESKFSLDKEHHVMAIVCQKHVVVLAFQSRQSLIKWEVAIRSHLGEEKKFKGKIAQAPPQAKFPIGPSTIFVLGEKICVTTSQPPRVLGTWQVSDLRKYGAIGNKFCFEAGSRCDKLAGLFAFHVEQPQQVENSLKHASQKHLSRSRPSLRSSVSSDSRSHYNNASVISGVFDPPLPSPSYSNYTNPDLSLVNEEEEGEADEGPGVTFTFDDVPAVRFTDNSRVHVVDQTQGSPTRWRDLRVPPPVNPHYQRPSSSKPPGRDYVEYAQLQLTDQRASRRYSCGDLTGPEGQAVPAVDPVLPAGETIAQSVQRNIDVLGPKLSHCASGEQQKSATLPHSKRNSGYAVASHGQPGSHCAASAIGGSAEIVDAFLKGRNNGSPAKSSSNSSCSSTRDLAENTPTVSCNIGKRASETKPSLSREVIKCNVCQSVLVGEDGVLASCNCSSGGYDIVDSPRCRGDSREGSLLRCQTEPILRKSSFHSQPLQPVNFNRYDGHDDGEYLYWVRGANAKAQAPMFFNPSDQDNSPKHSRRMSAAAVASKLLRDPQYVNIPSDSEIEVKKSKQKSKQWKNKLMTIHDSLRRPKNKNSARGGDNKEQDSMVSGSYVRLQNDNSLSSPLCRARGKSLEDVLCGRSDSPEGFRSGSQPGTPSRARRTGKRLPPPFEPAPAIPVKTNDFPTSRSSDASEHIYAVPVVYSSKSTTEPVFKAVQPYANQNLLSERRPMRRQTVCSSEFSHRRNQNQTNDTVFCNVQLPSKTNTTRFSGNFPRTGAPLPDTDCDHDSAYLRMNMGTGQVDPAAMKGLGRSASVHEGPSRHRPKLHHSRSLDNELDSDGGSYLEMNLGNGSAKGTTTSAFPHASVILEDSYSNYMPMSPGASGYVNPSTAPAKPFDNLIEHQHHSSKRLSGNVRLPPDRLAEEKSSTDEEVEKSTKTPGLLSRFMRRNSSNREQKDKEKKPAAAVRTEETSASIIPEDADPGVRVLYNVTVPTAVTYHRESDPDIHEHVPLASGYRSRSNSSHLIDSPSRRLGPVPEKDHPYSYLDASDLVLETSNLSVQRGDTGSYSSLLDLPPAPPPPLPSRTNETAPAEDVNGNQAVSPTDAARAPLLPPKTYRDQNELYTDMSAGGNRASTGVQIEPGRPKLPTPEPEDRSQKAKESTPPPSLPHKAGSVKRNSNMSFDRVTDLVPLLTSEGNPVVPPSGEMAHTGSAHVVYYNDSVPVASSLQRKAPNLRVDVPASISATKTATRKMSRSESSRQPSAADDDDDIWMLRELPSGSSDHRRGTFSSSHSVPVPGRGRIDSCQSDSSVSTSGSTDTYHSVAEEHRPSPATNTLRPRSGKEYQRVDRRKLAEVLDVPLSGDDSLRTTPQSPITPSMGASSVFTFDVASMGSHASFMTVYSSGDDSPKFPPSITSRQSSLSRTEPHTYVNLTFPKNESPRFMDTPPASPRYVTKVPEQANPQLNYAEIDLSDTDSSKKPRKPKREGTIEYAMIDMVATAAASKVGREHAKNREDSLRIRKDNLRRSESDARDMIRGGKDRRSLMNTPGGSRRERVALIRSASSASARDRKASNSSYN